MASRRRYVPVLLLLALLSPWRVGDVRADELVAPGSEIDLGSPESDGALRGTPTFVEEIDMAGRPPFFASDVVIVIDRSTLALVASGIDVDEDGVVGLTRREATERRGLLMPGQFWSTDPGDTVHALQLRIAQAVVSRLATRENNVGLISFALRETRRAASVPRLHDEPEVVVPVGAPEAVLSALADFPPARERTRTDLSRLLGRAAQLLDVAAASHTKKRQRSILLFFLGEPSAPDGVHWSSRQALRAADELGERGIAVWAIPIRPVGGDYLDELTRRSGGQVIPLDQLDARFGAL